MGIRNYLLFKYSGRLKCRLISPAGLPYLERYHICTVLGRTWYLHRFVSADAERHMHNHPYDCTALVLAGSYVEDVVTDICPHAGASGCVTKSQRVRWFNRIDGAKFHRIRDAAPGTWTLFTHGTRLQVDVGLATRLKGWGFLSTIDVVREGLMTVFTPFIPTGAEYDWWISPDTKIGSEIGRVPL